LAHVGAHVVPPFCELFVHRPSHGPSRYSSYRKRLKRTVISSLLQCSIAAIKFAAASVSGVVGKHHQPSAGIQACGLPPHHVPIGVRFGAADIPLMNVDLRTKTVLSVVRAAVGVISNKAIAVV
jgi:hypothetical protein